MANGMATVQRGALPRRGRSSSDASVHEPKQGLGWLPIAFGTAVVMAGLGLRKKGVMPLALTALAGVAAVAAVRDVQLGHGRADSNGQGGASGGEPEVERSITIGKSADELRRCWLDSTTLPQLMRGFATVRAVGDGRTHWEIEGPLGRAYEWDSATENDRPNMGVRWRSLPDAAIANEGSVRFRPASAGRGTVVTLRLRFDPPVGAFGGAAVKLLATTPLDLAVDAALRRFKSLAETGEIPTTERQPAARADTR